MFINKTLVENKVAQNGLKLVWDYNTVGTRRKNYLCLNPNLLKDPKFLNEVLEHELKHTDNFDSKDLIIDAFEGSFFKHMSFCFKHPRAFKSFIPIDKFKGDWYFDITTTIFYFLIILFIIFVWWLL